MKFGGRNISAVRFGGRIVNVIYFGARVVWQSIRSCFGMGVWRGEKPWRGEDKWKSNV